MSRAFLYLLAVSGPEDLIKIGLTRDPLARWSSFHPRWFENFDLDRSQLVETETRKDAQRLETRLHRLLHAHSCPMPLTLSQTSGGNTEWYRGAMPTAAGVLYSLAAEGFITHASARPVVAVLMDAEKHRLFSLVAEAYRRHFDGALSITAHTALKNWVEAHRVFGTDVQAILPSDMRQALHLDE